MGYKSRADRLDRRWMNCRHYAGFCHDGVLSPDPEGDYFSGDCGPRILYLLKETGSNFTSIRGQRDYHSRLPSRNSSPFWIMLGMWANVLDTLADGNSPDIDDFYNEHDDGGYSLANVAYVNIKKEPGPSKSSDSDLRAFARRDRSFLNEQIDLCAPQIIVCCGTYAIYEDIICDGELEGDSDEGPLWDSYNERIVIPWVHPFQRRFRNPDNRDQDFWNFASFCQEREDLFENL